MIAQMFKSLLNLRHVQDIKFKVLSVGNCISENPQAINGVMD